MRKWISGVKLSISERIEKEEDTKFREEYAEAHPSEEPLTGPLSDENKDKVQERVDSRFDSECDKKFSAVTEKARILLKLRVPEILIERANIERSKTIQKSLSMKLREKLNLDPKNLTKKKTIVLNEGQVAEKDTEYDWT